MYIYFESTLGDGFQEPLKSWTTALTTHLILHVLGNLVRIEDARHTHVILPLLILGRFQRRLPLLKVQVAVVLAYKRYRQVYLKGVKDGNKKRYREIE